MRLEPKEVKQVKTETVRRCILCDELTKSGGIWRPKDHTARLLGQPAGKFRTIAYGLCNKCEDTQGSYERVEAAILDKMGVEV